MALFSIELLPPQQTSSQKLKSVNNLRDIKYTVWKADIQISTPKDSGVKWRLATTPPLVNDSPPFHIWSFYGIFYRKVMGFTEIP